MSHRPCESQPPPRATFRNAITAWMMTSPSISRHLVTAEHTAAARLRVLYRELAGSLRNVEFFRHGSGWPRGQTDLVILDDSEHSRRRPTSVARAGVEGERTYGRTPKPTGFAFLRGHRPLNAGCAAVALERESGSDRVLERGRGQGVRDPWRLTMVRMAWRLRQSRCQRLGQSRCWRPGHDPL
jgi:hypothetical protein